MDLSNWKLDPKVTAEMFTVAKAASAIHIAFARPDAGAPKADTPPRLGPPSAPKPTQAP
jgi:hypothetical protein